MLSGLRLLEKFGWISSVVRASDWLLIEAIKRIPVDQADGRSKEWATLQCISRLCRSARSPKDWEVVALSALSIAFGLGISEVVSAAPDGQLLHFTRTMGRRGHHHPEMGLWERCLGDFLARLRALAGHHPHRPAFFAGKLQLQADFAALLQAEECHGRTIRWHGWRPFGAAQLQSLDLSLHPFQLWGGWNSPAIARLYDSAPFGWSFVKGGPLAVPIWKGKGDVPWWEEIPGTSLSVFSPWIHGALPQVLPNSGPPRLSASPQATNGKRLE